MILTNNIMICVKLIESAPNQNIRHKLNHFLKQKENGHHLLSTFGARIGAVMLWTQIEAP